MIPDCSNCGSSVLGSVACAIVSVFGPALTDDAASAAAGERPAPRPDSAPAAPITAVTAAADRPRRSSARRVSRRPWVANCRATWCRSISLIVCLPSIRRPCPQPAALRLADIASAGPKRLVGVDERTEVVTPDVLQPHLLARLAVAHRF